MSTKSSTHKKIDSDITFYAFRYALGRMTYATQDVSDYIINHWLELEPRVQELIKKEITEAIEKGEAGMKMDEDNWRRILSL